MNFVKALKLQGNGTAGLESRWRRAAGWTPQDRGVAVGRRRSDLGYAGEAPKAPGRMTTGTMEQGCSWAKNVGASGKVLNSHPPQTPLPPDDKTTGLSFASGNSRVVTANLPPWQQEKLEKIILKRHLKASMGDFPGG